MILIFTTFHKLVTARKIGDLLLKERLIACYNLFPVKSAYLWKGKIEKSNEVLIILKTKDSNFEKIKEIIQEHSGYEVPEVVAIKSSKVSETYLNWLISETK
ncbi:divalent-cation tolerance protein CutA [Candidatus Curtissbacteria bacterium]|nr:divalent-cation tolerance protein CutA [Candidatus Curtissbacteria bacterium]